MRRFDSCIFCAILRRRPTILTSCVASEVAAALGADWGLVRGAAAGGRWASRSAWTMRPALPVAVTSRRSTPSSQARARTAGEAIGRGADDVGGAAMRRRRRWRGGARRGRRWRGRSVSASALARHRCGEARCRRRLGRRRPGRVLDLDADQLRPDGEHLPDLAAEREHLAGDRRRDLDRGLVGHHVGEALVLDDRRRRRRRARRRARPRRCLRRGRGRGSRARPCGA